MMAIKVAVMQRTKSNFQIAQPIVGHSLSKVRNSTPAVQGRGPGSGLQTVRSAKSSPTEQRHPRSMNLDKLPLAAAIKLMLSEEAQVPKPVEGAEDDAEAGCQAMKCSRVGCRDVVVGISASGTTPFVWGALRHAKRCEATTVLVCFNPLVRIPPAARPAIVIALKLGPEVLTGSTRLKAGTATKLLLNIFTTLADRK